MDRRLQNTARKRAPAGRRFRLRTGPARAFGRTRNAVPETPPHTGRNAAPPFAGNALPARLPGLRNSPADMPCSEYLRITFSHGTGRNALSKTAAGLPAGGDSGTLPWPAAQPPRPPRPDSPPISSGAARPNART